MLLVKFTQISADVSHYSLICTTYPLCIKGGILSLQSSQVEHSYHKDVYKVFRHDSSHSHTPHLRQHIPHCPEACAASWNRRFGLPTEH